MTSPAEHLASSGNSAAPLSRLSSYVMATVLPILSLGLRLEFDSWFGGRTLLMFVPALFFSTYLGGTGPGLLATALTALGANYFVLQPRFSLELGAPADFLQWLLLIFIGLLFVVTLPRRQTATASQRPTRRDATERKVQAGFMAALLCLLAIGVASYFSVNALQAYSDRSRISADTIATLRQILGLATDAETAQRGYALTGDEHYIEPYVHALPEVENSLAKLHRLADDDQARRKLEKLEALVKERLLATAANIETQRKEGLNPARAVIEESAGKQLHDRLREHIAEMEADEQMRLTLRLGDARRASTIAKTVIALGTVSTLLFLTGAMLLISRELASTRRAEAALQQAHDSLESRVLERTEDLARSHAAMQASEARIAGIIDTAMDGIISIDEQQRIMLFNSAAEQMFGYRAADIIGQSVVKLMPQRFRETHAGRVDHFRRASSNAMRAPGPLLAERANGDIFHVEASLSKIDIGGQLIYTIILRDISERLAAEEALRQREQQLTQVTDLLPGPVSRIDRDGRYVFANAAYLRWFGKTPAEVLGRTIPEVVGDTFYQRVRKYLVRAAHGERLSYEATVHSPADGMLHAEATLIPEFDTAGKPAGYFVVYVEMTERIKAEAEVRKLNADLERRVALRTQELAAANRELEAFSYSVSHDLRAPLRAISGFSRILIEDHASQLDAEGQRYLELIRKNGVQMGALIDDLLSFSRLSRQALKRREIQTVELVRECLDSLMDECANRPIELSIAELPACWGDPALLRQVWINLLSNALKYTRPRNPARIEIGCSLSTSGDGSTSATYFVRDNGVGFDMRYSDKLFRVFQRFHRAEDYEGTGVGLAIAQRIIQRHGGRIWAQSTPDEGSCFHFTIGTEDA